MERGLDGVCGGGARAVCSKGRSTGSPSQPLFTWNWSTTFNGNNHNPQTGTGGAQLKSVLPLDPNSGTGGITITSLNGVPQTPPSVSCMATPNTLWPPNGKAVYVTVSG